MVLVDIGDNKTDLMIAERTTDPVGSQDMLFALFDLLGLFFCPECAT